MTPISLAEKFGWFSEQWAPKIVGLVNTGDGDPSEMIARATRI